MKAGRGKGVDVSGIRGLRDVGDARATCNRRGRICCARAQISREYVSTRLMNIHVNKTAVLTRVGLM